MYMVTVVASNRTSQCDQWVLYTWLQLWLATGHHSVINGFYVLVTAVASNRTSQCDQWVLCTWLQLWLATGHHSVINGFYVHGYSCG